MNLNRNILKLDQNNILKLTDLTLHRINVIFYRHKTDIEVTCKYGDGTVDDNNEI